MRPRCAPVSFYDLVGAREQRLRDGEPQRLRGLQVDHQFEPGRFLDRELSRLRPPQDFADVARGLSMLLAQIRAVRNQAAKFSKFAKSVDRREAISQSVLGKRLDMKYRYRVGKDHQRVHVRANHFGEHGIELRRFGQLEWRRLDLKVPGRFLYQLEFG